MDFHDEVLKLIQLPLIQNSADDFGENDTSLVLDEMNHTIIKFDKRHKEILYHVEEINESLQNQKDENSESENLLLIETLISIADYIEDFYIFASIDGNISLLNQAEMIWNSILKKLALSGLIRIHDEKTKFDVKYNTVTAVETDELLPEGFIIRTLRSGYIYQNKTIRKSNVVINK